MKIIKVNESFEDNLKEDILNEKKWVEVSPTSNGTPFSKPFYFYAIDGTSSVNDDDIQSLIPIITDKGKKGTYKQQLNRKIVDRLKADYQYCQSSGTSFGLTVVNHSVNPKHVKNYNSITLTDRDLRNIAQDTVTNNNNYGIKGDFLVHHKVLGEKSNGYHNIALISKSAGLDYAQAVHKIIEHMTFPLYPQSTTINILEFNTTSKTWGVSHQVDITIK